MRERLEELMKSSESHNTPVKPATHCVQSAPVKFSAQTALIARSIVRKPYMPVKFCLTDSSPMGRLWLIKRVSTKSSSLPRFVSLSSALIKSWAPFMQRKKKRFYLIVILLSL